ncbi:MAG: hypothetical protein B7X06_03980 [Verrucomicrobia bacterium 21-51-4]|nr:MAG: hypothetical protein B7X06_03980 [Verrucomicrobia bacterium 21-51-4]
MQVQQVNMAEVRAMFDALARQLVNSVNAAYNPASEAGKNFFNPAGLTCGTIALDSSLNLNSLRASVNATTTPGANELANAVAALHLANFSTASGGSIDGTFTDQTSLIVLTVGNQTKNIEDNLEFQKLIDVMTQERRASISSVSINEEVTNILTLQRAFQAISRIMNIFDGLLEQLVLGMGH